MISSMLRTIRTRSSLNLSPLLPSISGKLYSLIAASSNAPVQSRPLASSLCPANVGGVYSERFGRSLQQSPCFSVSGTTVFKAQMQGLRCMNSDSHDDFGPVKKSIPSNNEKEVHDMIQDHVTKNSVMLYMKGNPQQPMCGFSATVTKILQSYNVDFSSVNVLDYPTLRDGIKTFSNWPTIPQLYINGEFVGGCDIVKTMHENGELKELLDTIPKTTDPK